MMNTLTLLVLAFLAYALVFVTVFVAVVVAFLLMLYIVVKAIRRQASKMADANSD